MARLRIGLGQVNATVGDLAGNSDKVIEWTMRAAEQGARLVVFPEMVLTGYPVEDLALRRSFVDASIARLHALAAELADEGLDGIAVVLGYLDRRTDQQPRVGVPAGAPLDAAAVLHGGRVAIASAKHHLPNYGVFDEYRYFLPGSTLPVFRLTTASGEAVDIAVAICEDLWQDGGPVAVTRQAGASLLVVPNASPYERNKDDVRLALCQRRALEAGTVLAYANMVGGQDELVFDGDSIIVAPDGTLLARGPQFEEALVLADLELAPADPLLPTGQQRATASDAIMTIERVELAPLPGPEPDEPLAAPMIWPRLSDLAEIYGALVVGTRDYVRKNGFGSVILALSGGIDSALTATIAADALGPDRVQVVLMPSQYSSDHSVTDAEDLVKRQGVRARTVPIQPMFAAFTGSLDLHGLAAENLQARIRGMISMSLSNSEGHLVLATGNKSELATGYSTLYGDSAGGYAPIKDVPKTLVWDLSRWRTEQAAARGEEAPIPENSISKPPSAELAPGQLDSDSLPDYYTL
ncbi:MAG: NAD+ synthase, partial [Streptosporangiaceae bacterium]